MIVNKDTIPRIGTAKFINALQPRDKWYRFWNIPKKQRPNPILNRRVFVQPRSRHLLLGCDSIELAWDIAK